MSTEQKQVSLSATDLKEIIAGAVDTAVKAAKAPSVLEQAALDRANEKLRQDNENRKDSAQQIRKNLEQDNFRKRVCPHEGGRPKHSHTVFVSDDLGGYVLCQACRAVIRPENQLQHFPKDFQSNRPDVIFDTALFNKVFQATDASGVFA